MFIPYDLFSISNFQTLQGGALQTLKKNHVVGFATIQITNIYIPKIKKT
jgi:hypothetical protein